MKVRWAGVHGPGCPDPHPPPHFPAPGAFVTGAGLLCGCRNGTDAKMYV